MREMVESRDDDESCSVLENTRMSCDVILPRIVESCWELENTEMIVDADPPDSRWGTRIMLSASEYAM